MAIIAITATKKEVQRESATINSMIVTGALLHEKSISIYIFACGKGIHTCHLYENESNLLTAAAAAVTSTSAMTTAIRCGFRIVDVSRESEKEKEKPFFPKIEAIRRYFHESYGKNNIRDYNFEDVFVCLHACYMVSMRMHFFCFVFTN